jgi:hypothetical protein
MKITGIEVIPFETFLDRFSNGDPYPASIPPEHDDSPIKSPAQQAVLRARCALGTSSLKVSS